MSLKNAFTIIFGKLMVKTLHLLGRDAGNFPGLVLWTINKDCLKAFKVDCPIVAVTGTNGKTSVTNYLSHIFASGGKKIITNPEGNNLDTGICSLLLKKSQIGRPVMRKKSIDFSFGNGYYRYDNLILRTTAAYQTENASVALVAARSLKEERIDDEAVRKGLYDAFWPGRMEEILPRVFLDGAHNEDGIEAFLTSVSAANTEQEKAAGKRLLLFGVVADKQYDKMIGRIAASQLFSHIAVTVLASDRSASIDKLKVAWAQYKTADCSFHESAEEAFHYIQSIQKEADTIYIAGSLYLVGQIKTLVRRTPDD